jgi:membrane protein required for colicin V production
MNALDVAFLAIVGVSLLYSTWKGFVRDAFSLIGLLGGFLVAARFYPFVADWVKPWISTPWASSLAGCVILFAISFVVISMLGRMVWQSLRILRLGWLDRIAGFGFGLLKGVLLCGGLFLVLMAFVPPKTPLLTESRLAPLVMELTWEIGRRIPGQLGDRFRSDPSPGRPTQGIGPPSRSGERGLVQS